MLSIGFYCHYHYYIYQGNTGKVVNKLTKNGDAGKLNVVFFNDLNSLPRFVCFKGRAHVLCLDLNVSLPVCLAKWEFSIPLLCFLKDLSCFADVQDGAMQLIKQWKSMIRSGNNGNLKPFDNFHTFESTSSPGLFFHHCYLFSIYIIPCYLGDLLSVLCVMSSRKSLLKNCSSLYQFHSFPRPKTCVSF